MPFITFRTSTTNTRSGGLLTSLLRLVILATATIAFLAAVLVGFLVVLPLVLAGGIAAYVYLRRRLRQAQPHSRPDVIEAEYTVIDQR